MSTPQTFLDIHAGRIIDHTSPAQAQAILSDPAAIPTAKDPVAPMNLAQSATDAFCKFTEAQDPVSADPRAGANLMSPASILETVTKLSALLAPGCLTDVVPFNPRRAQLGDGSHSWPCGVAWGTISAALRPANHFWRGGNCNHPSDRKPGGRFH